MRAAVIDGNAVVVQAAAEPDATPDDRADAKRIGPSLRWVEAQPSA